MMTKRNTSAGYQLLTVLYHCKTDEDRKRHIEIIDNHGTGMDTLLLAADAAQEAINVVRLDAKFIKDKLWKERSSRDLGYVSHKIESITHDTNRIVEIYASIIKLLNEQICAHDSKATASNGMI